MLLVELAPHEAERRFRVEAYPLLLGAAAATRWKAWWCAVGVRYAPTLHYALDPVDLSLLCAEAARRRPSLIILNEHLRADQCRALAAAAGGSRMVLCPVSEALYDLPAFIRSVRLSPPEGFDEASVFNEVRPSFARKVLNLRRAPWAATPLTRIVAGHRCTYRARIAPDGPFGGLARASSSMGCSFCGNATMRLIPWPVQDPVRFASDHVEAARRAGLRRFELVGARLWQRVGEFLDAVAARGVRDVELNFMPRIDEFLESRGVLERCLPGLAGRRIALRLYGMGVENFSKAENERLHKGISAEQVHRAVELLEAWMERWPGTFRASSLSMILFTPWTTPEDLLINLDHLGSSPLIPGPGVLAQRLQLFRGRPITRLAKLDGLLAARPKAAFYNSGCIVRFDQQELPWRFRHPQAGALYRIAKVVAAAGLGQAGSDPGIRALSDALASETPLPEDRLRFFRRVVEAALRYPEAWTLRALLASSPERTKCVEGAWWGDPLGGEAAAARRR